MASVLKFTPGFYPLERNKDVAVGSCTISYITEIHQEFVTRILELFIGFFISWMCCNSRRIPAASRSCTEITRRLAISKEETQECPKNSGVCAKLNEDTKTTSTCLKKASTSSTRINQKHIGLNNNNSKSFLSAFIEADRTSPKRPPKTPRVKKTLIRRADKRKLPRYLPVSPKQRTTAEMITFTRTKLQGIEKRRDVNLLRYAVFSNVLRTLEHQEIYSQVSLNI